MLLILNIDLDTHSGPCPISNIDLFSKIVHGFQPLTIFVKKLRFYRGYGLTHSMLVKSFKVVQGSIWGSPGTFNQVGSLIAQLNALWHLSRELPILSKCLNPLGHWLILQIFSSIQYAFPAGIYLLKFKYRNTRTRCEICSKLTIKTHWFWFSE